MSAAALLLVAASTLGPRADACRAALELAYDGATAAAVARLSQSNTEEPDVICGYVELLARQIALEQTSGTALDDAQLARVDAFVARTDERLAQDSRDARARFARAGAFGVRSRLHLFRLQRRPAATYAARMRAELLALPHDDALTPEADFGLGLYDYYADVLPRLFKLLRFFVGLPGGDRARGLARIEAARERALLHRTEAAVQLADIYTYYEPRREDDALAVLSELRARYAHAPLWALRLAECQRERLGLIDESAATARALIAASGDGAAHESPVAAAMARVQLAEALLLAFDAEGARSAVEPAVAASLPASWMARAHLALGRALELADRRESALAQYRVGLSSAEGELRERLGAVLRAPWPAAERAAAPLIAEARRLRAAGHAPEAAVRYRRVLELWPASQEASLRVAEDDLRRGLGEHARTRIERLVALDAPQPPWVKPWSRLMAARLDDLAGSRAAALEQYNEVFQHPFGSPALKALAADGRKQAYRVPTPSADGHSP